MDTNNLLSYHAMLTGDRQECQKYFRENTFSFSRRTVYFDGNSTTVNQNQKYI